MKTISLSLFTVLFANAAFALPGSYTLRCADAAKAVSLTLSKHEIDTDDFPAAFEATMKGKTFRATEEDSLAARIQVVNGLADKVFTTTYKQSLNDQTAELMLYAKPATVKITKGRLDSSYKAAFRVHYWLSIGNVQEGENADGDMSCTFSYSAGS